MSMDMHEDPILPEQPETALLAVQSIERLERSHNYLMECIKDVWQKPSADKIASIQVAAEAAISNLNPFYETDFYGRSDDDMATEASIKSLFRLISELTEQTNAIEPNAVTIQTTPDIEKKAVKMLTGIGTIDALDDEEKEVYFEKVELQTERLCDAYSSSVQICVNVLTESDSISTFLRRHQRIEKIKNNAATVGRIAAGTAIGYGLVRLGEYLVDKHKNS